MTQGKVSVFLHRFIVVLRLMCVFIARCCAVLLRFVALCSCVYRISCTKDLVIQERFISGL